jgi:plasmid maintenance system antidote protein VapI
MLFNNGKHKRKRLCQSPEVFHGKAAHGLGVTRQTLAWLLSGHAGISLEMAIRLSKAFGCSPESGYNFMFSMTFSKSEDRPRRSEASRFMTPPARNLDMVQQPVKAMQ